jgi:hypothetical protein
MNMHRRHLSTKQKKDIALELLRADPTMSDLAVAKTTRLSDKTVTKIRTNAAQRSKIPNVKVRTDSKGRQQPAVKPTKKEGAKLYPRCLQPPASNPKATPMEKKEQAFWALEDAWTHAGQEIRREFISKIGLVELYAQASTAQKEALAVMVRKMEPVS